MASPQLPTILWPHLTQDWDDVADIASPGLAAKLAAVRAGEAGTATLPVTAAAKVICELDDPHRSAAGDDRVAVRDALGITRSAKPKKRRTPSERLFDDTPEGVIAALKGRRNITEALAVAFRGAAPEVRDATWRLMLARGNARVGAEVLAERAETLGVAVAGVVAELVAAASNPAGRRSSISPLPVPLHLAAAARAVAAAWFAAHGDDAAGHRIVLAQWDEEPHVLQNPPPAGAAAAVGALCAAAGIEFCGPPDTAAGALAAVRQGAVTNPLPTLRSCGWARTPWHTVKDAFDLEDASARDVLVAICALSAGGHHQGAAEGVNDFYGGGHPVGRYEPRSNDPISVRALLPHIAEFVDPAAALRLWASTWHRDDSTYTWVRNRRQAHAAALVEYLTGAHRPTAEVVTAVLGGDDGHDVVADAAAAIIEAVNTSTVATGALEALHALLFGVAPCGELAAAAATTPAAAWVGNWANHIDALISQHATSREGRRDLWSAVLSVLGGFDGTTADAVDVAAAICGPPT